MTAAAIQSDQREEALLLTGTVSNFPRRRAVHPRLFFLEIQSANGYVHQVLFKHGRGGSYVNGVELEELRRNVRQGDTIQVEVGLEETMKNGQVLLHATQARILAVHIHGNTGSSYQKTLVEQSSEVQETNHHISSHEMIEQDTTSLSCCEEKEVHLPSKKERFAVFCEFVKNTFGRDLHIYDIAGGRGELSLLLTLAGYKMPDCCLPGVANNCAKAADRLLQ